MKITKDHSFRKAFMHVNAAQQYFQDVMREMPGTVASRASETYSKRIDWMLRDFKTNPQMPRYASEDFAAEMQGDIFFHESISLKCLDLSGHQKGMIENIIDDFLLGRETIVQITK